MADKTILQLTDIGQLEENDVLPIARVGEAADNSTTVGAIAEYVENGALADYNTIIKLTSTANPSRIDGSSSSSPNYKGYSVDVSELYGKGCVAVMFRGCNYSQTSVLANAIVPGLIFKEVASAQVVESYINNTSVPSTSVDWHILPITEDSKTLWATIGKSGTGDLAITPQCVIGLTQKELDAISAGANLENIYAELAKIGKIRYQGVRTGWRWIVSKQTDPFPKGTIIKNDSEMPISVYDEYNATYSDADASGPAYIIRVGEQWVADVPVYQLRTRGEGNFDVMVHPKGTLSCEIKELDMRILPVSKMFNVPVDLKKPNLRILDLGNSYTGDATDYLNALLSGKDGANITTGFSLYKCVRGSSSFRTWVNLYKETDDANYNVSKVAGDTISEISNGDHSGLDNSWFVSLLKNDWDIIIIHQESKHSGNYDGWTGEGDAGGLNEYLRILRTYCPQATIGFYIVHSYPSWKSSGYQAGADSTERWQNIANAVEQLKAEYGIDFIIPYGTAVQNLRMTSKNPADGVDETKKNDFSDDGTHLNSSIGDYVAACTYFEALFAPRYNVSVLGNRWRKTAGFPDAGGHVQPVFINDANALLAQRAAVLAVNDMFNLHNPEAEGFVPVNSDTKPVYTGDGSFNDVKWSEIKNRPTKVSDFTNDTGFITSSVNDLVNYYLKSETYTKTEVQALIAAIKQFTYQVVPTLPTASADTMYVIYLVPSADPQQQNVKDEYITIDNGQEAQTRYTWEQIGSTAIDLSGYYTSAQTDAAITAALNAALADYTTTAALTALLAGKQDIINDLSTIRSGASAGATAYQKPDGGIPSRDIASGVIPDISGKQNVIDAQHKLSADLVDDSNTTNKFVTSNERQVWNNKSDFSGSYNDLTNKPTIPTVPTNVGAFTNDAGYLTQHQDISGKEDKTPIVATSTTSGVLNTEVGKYYRIDVVVDTLAVTLPAMTDLTTVRTVVIYLTAGTTPAVTISSTAPSGGTAPDVLYQDGFEVAAGKTYEINCLWNGLAWVVASAEIIIPSGV